MTKKLMYKVSQSTGKTQTWWAWADGGYINVKHGELGGKLQLQTTQAEAKNVGRANATTAEEQAIVEVEALYEDRYSNKHYRDSIEEAKALSEVCKEPRKVHNFKDHGHKLPDEVYFSVKLNGSRACIINGELFSKTGRKEDIKVKPIREAVEAIPNFTADCEVYAHGLSLQRIRSAWLKPVKTDKEIIKIANERQKLLDPKAEKFLGLRQSVKYLGYHPNEDAPKLKLHIFDIPVQGTPFKDRLSMRNQLEDSVNKARLEHTLAFVDTYLIPHVDVIRDRDYWYDNGYEGGVIYSPEDMYEFGKRSYTCQKTKPRLDAEALVLDCTPDKSGQGVLHLQTTEVMGKVKFKAKMKGDAESRSFGLQKQFIGDWVTFSYEELSDSGTPTKPVVHETRKCNNKGEPLE